VKEPLKVPFVFLFILVCTTVVLAALNVMYHWGTFDSASSAFTFPYAMQHLPRSLYDIMLPAMILSIALLGFRLARRPFSRFLGLLIVLVVSYVVLVNGMIWLRSLSARVAAPPENVGQYLQPNTLTSLGSREIAVGGVAGGRVRALLVYDPATRDHRLSVAPSATAVIRGGTLVLTTATRPAATLAGEPERSWASVFAADRFTGAFLRDITTMVGDFQGLQRSSLGEFFAACFALLFLCTASLALLRITRWPLANIMLLVIFFRGYFSLYHLLAVDLAPRVAALVTDRLAVRMFPAAALGALGLLLLLVDIIFIPANRWKAEGAA
jgi:hypothetical protein